MTRYFRRTEAGCLVGSGSGDAMDDLGFVEQMGVLELDDTDPKQAKVADGLASWSHGWQEEDGAGNPVDRLPEPSAENDPQVASDTETTTTEEASGPA